MPVEIEVDTLCLLKLTVGMTSHQYDIKSNEVCCPTDMGQIYLGHIGFLVSVGASIFTKLPGMKYLSQRFLLF